MRKHSFYKAALPFFSPLPFPGEGREYTSFLSNPALLRISVQLMNRHDEQKTALAEEARTLVLGDPSDTFKAIASPTTWEDLTRSTQFCAGFKSAENPLE